MLSPSHGFVIRLISVTEWQHAMILLFFSLVPPRSACCFLMTVCDM